MNAVNWARFPEGKLPPPIHYSRLPGGLLPVLASGFTREQAAAQRTWSGIAFLGPYAALLEENLIRIQG